MTTTVPAPGWARLACRRPGPGDAVGSEPSPLRSTGRRLRRLGGSPSSTGSTGFDHGGRFFDRRSGRLSPGVAAGVAVLEGRRDAALRRFGGGQEPGDGGALVADRVELVCFTSTAPAVRTAAVTTPATALVPSAPPSAPSHRGAAAADRGADAADRSGTGGARSGRSAPAPLAPALAPPRPSLEAMKPLKAISGPTGRARERLLVGATWERKSALPRIRGRGGAPARGLAQALGGFGELEADFAAGQLTRLAGLGQRDPGPDQQRLDRGHRGLHRGGDFLVGEGVHLAQQQGRALGLGKLVASLRIWRNSSRLWTFSAVEEASTAGTMSIDSWASAVGLRRWLRQRLRAIGRAIGRRLISSLVGEHRPGRR